MKPGVSLFFPTYDDRDLIKQLKEIAVGDTQAAIVMIADTPNVELVWADDPNALKRLAHLTDERLDPIGIGAISPDDIEPRVIPFAQPHASVAPIIYNEFAAGFASSGRNVAGFTFKFLPLPQRS